ncbi:MAG: hypothetical protein OXN83_04610, partial [Oligoflexia bacterium]|nr:hypothetical protein [Oligoflexia bacterium]
MPPPSGEVCRRNGGHEHQDIPCHIDIPGATRLGPDRFRVSQNVNNGIVFRFQVGQDDDRNDERIDWSP